MTYTSPSDINASKGIMEVLNYTNTVTDNWFGSMILVAIWVILAIGYYKAQDDFAGAVAIAGYGTFVIALFFWLAGFVSGNAFAVTVGATILGTLFLLLDNRQ
jgi:hypothetical protein